MAGAVGSSSAKIYLSDLFLPWEFDSESVPKDAPFDCSLILATTKKLFLKEIEELPSEPWKGLVHAYRQIVGVESLCDLEGAKSTIKLMAKYPWLVDEELLKIVKLELSKGKLDDAIATANEIKAPDVKILAYCNMSRADPRLLATAKDLLPQVHEDKRDRCLLEIAKIHARYKNFNHACVTAYGIDKKDQPAAFVEITKIIAEVYNFEVLKSWVDYSSDPDIRNLILFEIALLEGDAATASSLVDTIEMSQLEKARAYLKLARLGAPGYIKKTKACLTDKIDKLDRVKVLIEIAELSQSPDFSEAMKCAQTKKNFTEYGLWENDDKYREIALAQAKNNIKAARETAGIIQNDKVSERTKCDIEIVAGDLDSAKKAADQIHSGLSKLWANIEIARKDPQHDLTHVKPRTCVHIDVCERISAICAIARIMLGDYT